MRFLFTLMTLAAACYGVWWLSETKPEVKTKVEEILNSGSFNTLEIRYTANQIMDAQRKQLLKDNRHKFLEPYAQVLSLSLIGCEVCYFQQKDKRRHHPLGYDRRRDGDRYQALGKNPWVR